MLECAHGLVSFHESGKREARSHIRATVVLLQTGTMKKTQQSTTKGRRPSAPTEDCDGHCLLQENSQACLPGKDHRTKTDGGCNNKGNDGELAQHAMAHLERGSIKVGMMRMVKALLACCRYILRHVVRMQRRQQQHRHEHRQQHPRQPSAVTSFSLHACKGKNNYQDKEKNSYFCRAI